MPNHCKAVGLHSWKARKTRAFNPRRDGVRSLLVIDHPWTRSYAKGYGQWETTVNPPKEWRSGQALFVSFYESDNYAGSPNPDPHHGTQALNGHRFKQLLVNGRLVWEQDVADEGHELSPEYRDGSAPPGAGYKNPYHLVEISELARDKITLVFRVFDKAASTTQLPGDKYKRYPWSAYDPHEAKKNFQTTVYIGDVHVTTRREIVKPKMKPLEATPPSKRAVSLPKAGIPLSVVTPGRIPRVGYPVRSGVPIPQGIVASGTPFCLVGPKGEEIPVATRELSCWRDGSLSWVLCEFVARRKGRYRLVPGRKPVRPRRLVRVSKKDGVLSVENGVVGLKMDQRPGSGLFNSISCRGGIKAGTMDFSVKLNRVGRREQFTAHRQAVTVEHASPVCATIRVDGEMLNAERQRFGSFQARFDLWAGLPFLMVAWRLVNESDQAMATLLDWSANLELPGLDDAMLDFGRFSTGYDPDDIAVKAMGHCGQIDDPRAIPLYARSEASCRQELAQQARLYRNTQWVATAERAAGFINLQHSKGGLAGAMRWFAEEFPKGIVVRPDLLKLATLPEYEDALGWPHDRPSVRIGRGEAKRQTFALWFHDGGLPSSEAERFVRCLDDPPHLFDQRWFISSGCLDVGPPRRHPGIRDWAEKVTPSIEWTGIAAPRLGHREYWDTCWSNDYRGRAHVGLLQYVETANPAWMRYFDAACTHNRDVDIVHFCPEHPEHVGAVHAYGEDHTACGVMSHIGLNCDSLLEHYYMTGDPDSLDAAAGIAERILDLDPWSRSARAVGWPLAQVVRWYDHAGDPRFLRKAEDLMAVARAYVEPRRGVFEETSGWNYRGTTPFMTGYLAFGVIRYHQLTRDPDALELLRLIVTGVFTEGQTTKGHFRYCPLVELNLSDPDRSDWNGLIGGMAGYLYEATGQRLFRDWTLDCYRALVDSPKRIKTTMDMTHTACWMLRTVTHT